MPQRTFEKFALITFLSLFSFSSIAQNQALDLSGTGNEVNVTYNLSTGPGFTVEQWIYIPTITAGVSLVNQTNSNLAAPLDLYVQADGALNLWTGDGTTTNNQVTSIGTISAATWHHIAVVYDPGDVGNERKIYLDGNTTPLIQGASPALSNIGPIRIGRRADIFEGDDIYIDEVRIWSTARDGAAINADYNQELIGNEANLDVYLRFEGSLNDDAFVNLFQNGNLVAGSINYIAGAPIQTNNYALIFDGVDEYLTTDNAAAKQINQGTIEAWVNASSATAVDWSGIAVKQLAYGLFVRSDVNANFGVYDWNSTTYNSSGVSITDDTWHHVAFSFDNGVANGSQLYLDGVAVGPAFTYTINAQTNDFVMAAGAPAGSQHLNGSLDEVRIWNTVRSASQINAFKDVEVSSLMPGLIAYYNFSDGPNTGTVSDLKGGNPGLLTNMEVQDDWIAATHGVAPAGPLDTTDPNVSITSSESDPTASALFQVTITFTEEVVGFDLSDIIVTNGTPSNLNTADNIVFTADIAPTAGGVVSVDVFTAAATDLTGNFNTSAPTFNITYDVELPVIVATSLSATRNRIYVEFDAGVYGAADGTTPVDAGDFNVNTTGGTASVIVNSLNVLSPSEIEFDVTISGVPDGAEVVDVTPNATSVYDVVGNIMSTVQTANQVGLIDQSVLSLDGVDDFVRIPANAVYDNQNYTLEAWVNFSDPAPTGNDMYSVVSKGVLNQDGLPDLNGYSLLYGDNGGTVGILLGHKSSSGVEFFQHPVTFNADQWYHIAGTYDGSEMKIFLDGVEVGVHSSLVAFDIDHAGDFQDLKIGVFEGNTNGNFLRGKVDEVRVWNYARNAGQISSLMDEEISGSQNGLVVYYDFSDAAGTILTETVAGRNGTLTNMDLTGATGNWASGGEILAPADVTAPVITFAENLQTIGTTIIGGTHDDNLAAIEVSLDAGSTRTPAINNGDGTWNYDLSTDPLYGGNAPYTLHIYIIDEAENEDNIVGNVTLDLQNALDFDGVDDGVSTGITTPYGTANFTWEAWFYSRGTDAVRKIIAKDVSGNDPELTLDVVSGTTLRFKLGSADIQAPINTNEWYHVAAVRDGLNHYLYLNGELVGSQALGSAVNHTFTNPITIGMRSAAGSHFNGLIDEVRLWSVARSQTEIVDNAYTTLSSATGLVRSFDFDQLSGNPIDLTGTADGTFNGAPFYATSTALDSDIFAPLFLASTPFTSNFGSDNFDLTVQLNELGLVSYVVLANGAATPTTDEIRAGTGFLGAPAVVNGTINVTTASTNFVENVTGLAPLTDYDVYIVAEDNEGTPNVSSAISIDILTLAGPSPGGIGTSLSLWLKADQGVTGTTQVSQWDDQAGGLRHATQATATNQPALTDAVINYNPAISFDGTDDFFTSALDISPIGSPDLTTIIVFSSDQDTSTPLRKLFGHDAGNFHRSIGLDNRSGNNFNYFAGSNGVGGYFDLVASTNYISTTEYTSTTFSGLINGAPLVGPNGAPITGGLTNLTIGAISPSASEPWDGDIAEVIMYSGTLTIPERQRVETYLAVKYGISIDQTSATNYVATDDNPVWDGTANAAYNQHIAGIGRDDMSLLSQKQSMSADGRLSIGLGAIAASNQANANTFTNDLAYLIWGDNGLDLAFGARDIANVPSGIDSRPQRIWRASEANSDVGNVMLRFDLNGEGYPATYNPGNFKLLLDTDADFSTGAIEITADSYAGGIVEFNSVNITNGQFFTLGVNEPPLPPTNFVVYNSSLTEITLEWIDNAINETGYQIIEADDYGFLSGIAIVDNIAANSTSYTHTPVADKFYLVVPTNGFEDPSSQSSIEFATTDTFPAFAVDFTTQDDEFDLGDPSEVDFGAGDFTIEMWYRVNDPNADVFRGLINKDAGVGSGNRQFLLSYDNNADGNIKNLSFVYFTSGDNGAQLSTPANVITDSDWHHIAVVRNGNSLEIYVDGNLEASGITTGAHGTMFAGTQNLGIGGNPGAGGGWAQGQMDEVRFWNLARTQGEIQTNRFNSLNGNEGGLVAYYPFDEGIGSVSVDRSGNVIDAIATGTAQFIPSTILVPLAPTNVVAYASSATDITVEWVDNATNETGYNVERAADAAFSAPLIVGNGLPANTTSFIDNAGADQRFFYRVQPTNGSEDASSYSEVEFGTTLSFAGDALQFDGSDDYIVVNNPSYTPNDEVDDYTMEAWIYPTNLAKTQTIVMITGDNAGSVEPSSAINITVSGDLEWIVRSSENATPFVQISASGLQLNQWQHVAAAKVGNNYRLYVDDVEVASALGVTIFNATNDYSDRDKYLIGIGWNNFSIQAGTEFVGQIDEVRIWSTGKSAFTDRFTSLQGNDLNLEGYYKFDEGVGSLTAYDNSANNNSGTLNGSPPATYVASTVPAPAPSEVYNTSDSGPGSLREAIAYANANPGTTITFNISGGGPYQITLATALPDITAAGTIIDGTTQPGWAFGDINNMVELDGSGLGTNVSGLVINDVANCEIYGLIVTGFTSISESVASIEINGDNADNAIIGAANMGNIIHGMVSAGISFQDADFLTIQGNRFGTFDGTTRSEINKHCIYGAGTTDNLVIGGISGIGEGNLISGAGNGRFGVRLNVQGAIFIKGNYIGTNTNGDASIFNEGGGIYLSGANSGEIGGISAGEENVISGNTTGYGIRLGGSVAVINNIIGLDATGTNAVSNGGDGIIIGGTGGVVVDGNIISSNGGDAITSTTGFGNADIINNIIGFDQSLTIPRPNGGGIIIDNGPGTDNRYGYKDNPNIIANNTGPAIQLTATSTGNTFATNQIYNNGSGIVLDAGANGSVAPPTIDNVTATDASGTGVDGTTIHLYLGDGAGQGQTFLDSTVVSGGAWSVSSLSLIITDQLVATATDYGVGIGTSEFSSPASIPVQNALAFDGTDDHGSIGTNVFGGPYTGPFTIEAWVNSSLTGNNIGSIGSGIFKNMESGSGAIGDLALTINNLGQIGLLNWREAATDADGYTVSDASIPADTWTHVAASWDGSVNRIFINGVEQTFTTASTSSGWLPGFEIGRVHTAVQWHYDGTMDELRVWNVARSTVDITNNLYNELDPGSEVNLVAYYQFNQASGTNIPDAKGSFDAAWQGSGGGTNTSPAWVASTALNDPASIVSNTNDTGAGSLRDAITFANANPGTTITFDIQSVAPWVIGLTSALPQITAANTVIDGKSQPGWSFGDPNGMVQIDGSGIGGSANGININAADVEVNGLILTGFAGTISNGAIYLASDAADNAIIGGANKGNIIHGTTGGNAIYIVNGDNATIQGNRIGTLDGITLSAIGDHGIATTNEVTTLTIGGDFFTGEGNLISGAPANRYGMNLFGSGGTGLSNVTIRGNKIGTNEAADGSIPNTLGGINILGTNSAITIGGPSPSDLNIISGNGDHGIIIQVGNGFDIDGNYIGLQSDGSSALGNGGSGIRINGTATNVNIGTNLQNFIAENVEYGIVYDGNSSSNTALGTNFFSCNLLGGIGYGSGPLTPGASIDNVGLTTATVSTAATDGSTVFVYFADDGCSNNQGLTLAGTGTVASGQAVVPGGFAPSSHYVALVEDVNGYSQFSSPFFANFVTVTNTNDTGTGSFRAAIDSANTYPGATIYFNLPGSGPWEITLASALPDITGTGTIIDATTQPFWDISTANIPNIIGNAGINIGLNFTSVTNVEVYGIRLSEFNIDGIRYNVVGASPNGYTFGAVGKGNIFAGNGNGIQVLTYSGGGTIQGNYFGILPGGNTAGVSNGTGILLGTNADNVQIGGLLAGEGNVISNNTIDGIRISNADMTTIQGNNIGLNPLETAVFGGTNGIDLTTATGVTIEQNVISGHGTGIRVNNSSGNTIIRNNIGVASDGTTEFGNNDGISIIDNLDSDNNIIGSSSTTSDGNIIAHNTNVGILISGAGNNGNQIQRNSMFGNLTGGISLVGGAHNGISAPAIDPIVSANTVTGTGTNGDEIDLYLSDGTAQGDTHLGSATVAGGVWSIGSLSLVGGDVVLATATNATDGTSEFSTAQSFTPQNALTLDGTGDYTNSGNIAAVNFDRTDPFTVEAWIQTTATGRFTIAGQQDSGSGARGYRIFVDNGLFRMSLNNFALSDQISATAENSVVNDGQWHHVAMTYDGSSSGAGVNMFIDGEHYNTIVNTDNLVSTTVSTAVFSVGSRNAVEELFTGSIDQVRVWSIVRTQDEIYDNAYVTLTTEPNLELAFDFDQTSGAAIDAVAANDGTLAGDAAYVASTAFDSDVFAPLFISGFPTISGIGSDNFDIDVQLNEIGDAYIVVVSDGAPAPTPAEIVLGQSSGGGVPEGATTINVPNPSTSFGFNIAGLAAATPYDVYVVAEDGVGNRQFQEEFLEFSTTSGAPYPELEGAGEALTFDGMDDFVQIPSGAPSSFTAEAWVKLATTTDQTILKYTNSGNPVANISRQLRLNGGVFQHNTFDGSSVTVTGTTPVVAGEWYHVAITGEDAGVVRLYVNGVEEGTAQPVGTQDVSGDEFRLGQISTGDVNFFNGEIDEVRIWDFVMPESSLREYLARKVTNAHPSFANLIAYYRMDDTGDAVNLLDFSGANNTTISGAAYTATGSGAHLGDLSIYEYVYTAGSGRNLNDFSTQNLGTANLPLHIYQVNQTPTNNAASGFNIIDDALYYGVFSPGQTYQARYSVVGVTPDRRILSRADLTDPSWVAASGFLGTEVQDDQIISPVKTGSGQYVTATQFMPYPAEIDGGSAVNFNGTSGDVQVNTPAGMPIGGSPRTIELWFRSNVDVSVDTDHGLVLYGTPTNDQMFGLITTSNDPGKLYFYGFNNDLAGTTNLNPNEWYHAAVTYDGTNLNLYLNGILEATKVATLNTVLDANGLTIGLRPDNGNRWNGDIDEVRVWSTALTETEIRDHMIGRIDPDVPAFASLVSAYKFDDPEPNTAYDLAGSNDGIITGVTKVISGAPQGQGSIYSYNAGSAKLSTAAFNEDIILNVDDASQGVHGYLIGGPPDQTAADGFNALDQTKYYGVFAPGNPKVDIRMDYNNGGSPDVQRRIVYRTDASDNAASGGWERVSGLINSDPTTDSVYAYNVNPGEFTTAVLNPPSTYPVLGDIDPGSSLVFDGSTQYVQLPNFGINPSTDHYTIELWAKGTALGGTDNLIVQEDGSGTGRAFLYFTGNNLATLQGGGSIVGTTTINNDQWYHLAITYDGINVTTYIDGVQEAQLTVTPESADGPFRIGSSKTGASTLTGEIDEVRIWAGALSVGDISTFANTTDISTHPNYLDMVAYYKFDDGTGSSILEDVFANNDGSLVGMDPGTDWGASGALANAPQQNALNFAGDNDNISLTRTQLPVGLTFEAWVQTSSTDATSNYVGNAALSVIGDVNNDVGLSFGITDGRVVFNHFDGSSWNAVQGNGIVNDALWHHIAATHDQTTGDVHIYVDGVLDMTGNITYDAFYHHFNRIGSSFNAGIVDGDFFDGSIDEVRIWNGVVAADDIRGYLYSTNLTGHPKEADLVLHYTMDQGDAGNNNSGETAVTDQSTSALDGSLVGFTLTGPVSNFVTSTAFDHSGVTASSLQATNIVPSNIMDNAVDITWTNGDGQRRIVAMFQGIETEMPIPSDNTYFNPDTNFASGDVVDGAWHAVYNGFGNTVSVSGLTAGTDYTIAVLETNGPAWQEVYNSGADADNPFSFITTGGAPEMEVTGLGVEIVSGDNTPDLADDTDFGNGGVTQQVVKTYTINNLGTADLNLGTDAVSASGDTAFEVGLQPDAVVTAGGSTTFTIVFTAPAENTFNSQIIIFNDDADENPYTFDVTGVGVPAAPSQQASNIVASNIMDNSVDLSWNFGNGWGTVVAIFEGNDPFPAPTDNTTYTANAQFGLGDDIGGGWFVTYVGTGTSVSITGLNPGQEYTVAALEFYGNPGAELYNASTEVNNPINFTTTGGIIPDATFTTIPVAGGNTDVGSIDNLIYQFTIGATGGNITKQGMIVAVGGDAVNGDFSMNGWKLYESVNSDTGIGGASLIGSTNIGDAAPDSVGFVMSGDILDGDIHYYYLAVDVDPAATVGHSFNVVLWNGDPTESIGIQDPKNKIDGGFVDGNTFTISGDATPPSVSNLTPSLGTIIDGDTQLDITIQFDEAMDIGVDPTILFPVEDPLNTLALSGGIWDDAFNYTVTYNVTDVNETVTNIDVQVIGAQDVAGNAMNIYDGVDAFNIDTENPIVTVDTYGTSITSPQLTGTIDDNSATIDIQVDGANYAATNNGDGTWTLAAGLITSLTDGTYDVIATATDLSGNAGLDATVDELVISQTVVTLDAENVNSTSFTARWSEGLDVQTYQIDVSAVADFSTFVTGFQGFQTTATSVLVNDLDFATTYYYRVRLVNTSMEISANSNTTQVITTIDPETVADSTALVQIFNAINPQGLNWGTDRLRDWSGISLDATRTRVEVVNISGTTAAGDMPNPFNGGALGGLSNMTQMNASNNQITGLMDFTGTAITNLNVSGNNLEFDDLEPVASITTVDYSNQASIQYNEAAGAAIEVRYTTDFSLSITAGGSGNVYTWFRNDVQITSGADFIVNNGINVILAIDYDNMGTFRTEVTNPAVPGLTINVDPQDVLAIADMQVTVSDANGDPLTAPLDGFMLETTPIATGFPVLETIENVNASTFTFPDVVLGDYIILIESDLSLYIPTYFGNVFEWTEADTLLFRSDDVIQMTMTEVPTPLGPGDGDGTLDVLIEEDFGDDTGGRIDARRRASKRKCGLRRKRSGGRTGQEEDEFELIAYGETDDNGEFQFGFLPQGTYRFFVEYPGIPVNESSFVQFDVGEAGVSDTDFKLQAFATEDGIEVTIEKVLGVILEYFKDLEIFPNPSNSYLNIRYRHLKSGDVTAQLVDLAGNTKWSQELRNGYDGQLRIDVTDFEEGVYILRFYDRENPQDNVVSFRVIVKD